MTLPIRPATPPSNDTSSQITVLEQRIAGIPAWAERHQTRLKYGGLFVAAVVLAPVVWTGVVGLAGGLVFTALAIAGTQALPVVARRMANAKAEAMEREANRHLQALKAEAQKNPVETLWRGYAEDERILEQRSQALVELDGKARAFGGKLDGFRKKFGANVEQLARFEDRQKKMVQVVNMRRQKLDRLIALHADKKQAIELGAGIWEMILASREFDDADGRTAEQRFEAEFKEQTAFDAIESGWHQTGAEFDQMMREELAEFRPSKTLQFDPSDVVDVSATQQEAKVPR
jgi:hypothetical protein